MALIQVTVDDDIKRKADAAFARSGITTPMAMRMMVTQVARENRTPFDGIFNTNNTVALAENVRRDMVYAEAQEYGLIPDDAATADSSYVIPEDVLTDLGLTAAEVGQ